MAGLPGSGGSTDGTGFDARFNEPRGVAVDNAGKLYVADSGNNTIRRGVLAPYSPAQPTAYNPPPMNGRIQVTLLPPEAKGQWRLPWELGWRDSGTVASNLAADSYTIEFRLVTGWLPIPPSLSGVLVASDDSLVSVTNHYHPTISPTGTVSGGGSLTVRLGPNPPAGAGWRFLGDPTLFLPPDASANLLPGTYLVEFAPVSGYSRPAHRAVEVFAGLPTILPVSYAFASSPPGGVSLPLPVPTNAISDLTHYPFGYNGQLQSEAGFGSGVAVQTNVVLTAAHLVFNDRALSYVNQVYWHFRQGAGLFPLRPMSARGWYVLSGYAAQRTNDLRSGFYGPDQSTPQSRNVDVAALYFASPVAGGGYGGYLPSDVTPNPWLSGNSQKMLVGYPVDGSLFGDASIVPGVMYATQPQPYALDLATDRVSGPQVYAAPWLLSYPGNSGGPLYVAFNGAYYAAGVYLGTLYNGVEAYASAVRAIDSNVTNLIWQAQTSGDAGTNSTGGGVITFVPNQAVSAGNPGYVQCQLGPPAAVAAGAGWRLAGDSAYSSVTDYTRAVVSSNPVVIEFASVPGWDLPTNQTVAVLAGQMNSYSASYTVTPPVLVADGARGIGITGTTGTVYLIQSRSSLTGGAWEPMSTNTIRSNGFNFVFRFPTDKAVSFYRAVWLP